ncbi:cupin domain-containing protein [Chryseobacterium antibioticum]|uniref:hypothetical protein n=1 Tax=Chryseobacterium antibioticum TaxID=2728847 RepID=UPI001E40BD08|nr:hypothetical protein [Chryseobacterium antibioticum]
MKPRFPVIMEDFVDPESPAFKKWNYEYFKEIAGDQKVNIYGSELESLDRVASSPIGQTTFSEYLDLISTKPTEHIVMVGRIFLPTFLFFGVRKSILILLVIKQLICFSVFYFVY